MGYDVGVGVELEPRHERLVLRRALVNNVFHAGRSDELSIEPERDLRIVGIGR